jgi:hypothetical protein
MCTVLLPPGGNPFAVKKYIIPYHIAYSLRATWPNHINFLCLGVKLKYQLWNSALWYYLHFHLLHPSYVQIFSLHISLLHLYHHVCRSQWPRGLRRRSAAARLLRLWFRIPPVAWMFVVVGIVCCMVEVSAKSWSLIQRKPTDCGASLCVI